MKEQKTHKEYDGIVFCKRCHHKLNDELARELGCGRVCYKKIQRERVNYLFDISNLMKKEDV